MPRKLILFGIGQLAEVATYYLSNDGSTDIEFYTVDQQYITSDSWNDRPLIAFDDILLKFSPKEYNLFAPIGYKELNKARERIFKSASAKGFSFISYVHSSVDSNSFTLGKNCFILERNTIQHGCTIRDNCILWSGNHIGHHTLIRENVFVASHAVISGSVDIGRNSFIGVNATIRDNIKIGAENIIGAGSLVLQDTLDKQVFSPKGTEPSRVPSNRIKI